MITRRGVGIIITAVGIFFLASITRVGWLHLTDAVLWGMIAMGLILPWVTVPGLRASRKIDTGRKVDDVAPVVGDEIDVQVNVTNGGILPRFLVTASYESSFTGGKKQRERVFFTQLPGGATTTGSNTVTCDLRGRHEVGSLTVESAAPFGEGAETTLEYAISIAASASRALVRNNHEVAIAAGGAPGQAISDWGRIMESLALVETGPLKMLGNAIAAVPSTARLLAIVSAEDRVSVKALASLALRGGSVSAIVLGGFTDTDDTTAAVMSLRATGVSTIECQRGAMEDCISEIESGDASHADAGKRRWAPADETDNDYDPSQMGRAA
jgi:uncharacterized protein (DUF58 family)